MNEAQDRMNIVRVFGQWLRLPIVTFVYGIDVLIKTMQEVQKVAIQGIEAVVGTSTQEGEPSDGKPIPENGTIPENGITDVMIERSDGNGITTEEGTALSYDNDRNCIDKNLCDEMLKLVRYKILFVKRDYEYAFPEREDLVYDNMDGNSFTAWKIAEFIQELARVRDETTPEGRARVGIPVPGKWKNYPRSAGDYVFEGYLTGFPPEDKKYLRVFYQVLERYQREKFRHDERQIEVLEEIRDRMPAKASGTGAAGKA